MADEYIHPDLVQIALSKADGRTFELFVHAFYPALAGIEFIPLGGHKDGGADAFQDLNSVWGEAEPNVFYQASIEDDAEAKITKTLWRLKEFGRDPTTLFYITPHIVRYADKVERQLTKSTKVSTKIRDRAYIGSHVNDSLQTRGAFRTHLGGHLDYLSKVGAAKVVAPSPHVQSPSVYVFLSQEIDRRSGSASLTDAIVDSLIIWALEDTDPDKGKFMQEIEIASKIKTELPFAKHLLDQYLSSRLVALWNRKETGGREIRFYPKEKHYCLPYEMREQVKAENAEDESLIISVLQRIESRISKIAPSLATTDRKTVANITVAALQKTFEKEGIEFAAFLEKQTVARDYVNVATCVDSEILERAIRTPKAEIYKEIAMETLRDCFYESSPEERLFLAKLAKTYALLFSLKAEPRIVTYFEQMASDFYLYVGTDLLVRALSERFVRTEDQRVRTLLRMLIDAGATLVLAEPVLDEVCHHLRNTDLEFSNDFAGIERSITYDVARNSPKILIRAYFYTRLHPREGIEPPTSWADYINQFCDLWELRAHREREPIRHYLMTTFGMQYEDRRYMESLVSTGKLQEEFEVLTSSLVPEKHSPELAKNDALMALGVYERRRTLGEAEKLSVFGYRTWWLTGESTILGVTKKLEKQRGSRYLMRPEFLLNFISMVPKLAEVRATYRSVFPSLLGVTLGSRIKEDVYRDMMERTRQADKLEPGRREALISEWSDQLKGDFNRVYDHKLDWT